MNVMSFFHHLWFFICSYNQAAILFLVSIKRWFLDISASKRLYVLRFTNVPTFKRVLRESRLINVGSWLFIPRVQHEIDYAWHCKSNWLQYNLTYMTTSDHFSAIQISVFSTLNHITEKQFMTVMSFFHHLWFFICSYDQAAILSWYPSKKGS